MRRASACVAARLGAAASTAWRAPSRCTTTGALPPPPLAPRASGFFSSSKLPKHVGDHAGACEVYTSAHRDTATRLGLPLGLGAGVFGSLVGVGGGVLIVPAMTATVPIPQRVITGTSLVAVLATASVSTVNFVQGGQIDFAAAAVVGAAAMVSAPLGARATAALDGIALKRALAYFLLCAAPLVPLKALAFAKRGETSADDENEKTENSAFDATAPLNASSLAAIGACAGFASGLLGIGGGTIVTPLLALTTPLTQATVLGTSLLAMLPPSAAALVSHARMGNVDVKIGAALALGCALGGFFGSGLAVDAPEGALETAFFLGMLFLSHRTFKGIPKGKVKARGGKKSL